MKIENSSFIIFIRFAHEKQHFSTKFQSNKYFVSNCFIESLIYDTTNFHFIFYCNTQSVMNIILISILICLIAPGGNPCYFSPRTSRGSQKICSDVSITIIENDDKDK